MATTDEDVSQKAKTVSIFNGPARASANVGSLVSQYKNATTYSERDEIARQVGLAVSELSSRSLNFSGTLRHSRAIVRILEAHDRGASAQVINPEAVAKILDRAASESELAARGAAAITNERGRVRVREGISFQTIKKVGFAYVESHKEETVAMVTRSVNEVVDGGPRELDRVVGLSAEGLKKRIESVDVPSHRRDSKEAESVKSVVENKTADQSQSAATDSRPSMKALTLEQQKLVMALIGYETINGMSNFTVNDGLKSAAHDVVDALSTLPADQVTPELLAFAPQVSKILSTANLSETNDPPGVEAEKRNPATVKLFSKATAEKYAGDARRHVAAGTEVSGSDFDVLAAVYSAGVDKLGHTAISGDNNATFAVNCLAQARAIANAENHGERLDQTLGMQREDWQHLMDRTAYRAVTPTQVEVSTPSI